jgi:peptide/nickel transport system ATP-binding protein
MEAFPAIKGPRQPLTGIPGSPPDLARLPQGCRFAPRCPQVKPRCETTRPDLYLVDAADVRCLQYDDGWSSQ